jgi:hypothetical protein
MNDRITIGADPAKPLRCSKLGEFAKCTMRLYLVSELLSEREDEGGAAAQNGSLTHVGVAEFHRLQAKSLAERKKAAWDAILASQAKFPLSDETEVRLFITPYMDDPRNINANVIAVEQEIRFNLPPHELDETGLPIYCKGTLDQLRLINNVAYVYDLKTGKRTGIEMIHDYATQMAAYTHAVREVGRGRATLHFDNGSICRATDDGEDWRQWQNAEPGCIIRNYGYRVRGANLPSPDGVFYQPPFDSTMLDDIMDAVRLNIALVRNGYVNFGPGGWCSYCEFGGLTGCVHQFKQLLELKRRSD